MKHVASALSLGEVALPCSRSRSRLSHAFGALRALSSCVKPRTGTGLHGLIHFVLCSQACNIRNALVLSAMSVALRCISVGMNGHMVKRYGNP